MIDSHAHIEMCEGEPAEIVREATINGVIRILTIGLSEPTFDRTLAIAEAHETVFAALGRHPNEAAGFDDAAAERIADAARHPRVRAIGETGLDFYRDNAPPPDQRRAFVAQIEIARALGLPLTIHARAAETEVLDLLALHAGDTPVILHCFSAVDAIDDVIERGYYCSFAGNVTYPNAGNLREAAARVPDDRLLVETDAPFLTPQPVRRERNRPAHVTMTAEVVAEVRGVRYDELSDLVEANARRLFDW